MRVHVHPVPEIVESDVCVLVDVLRATCTISAALDAGAKWVRPVPTIEEALKYRGKAILAGERNSKKIEGFDLGNSPLEVRPEVVGGREIVLTTSNGTKVLEKMNCSIVVAASFPNLPSVLSFLKRYEAVHVVCAGDGGRMSLEDFLLAGFIARMDEDPRDEARIAAAYASLVGRKVKDEVMRSSHARELLSLGYLKDLEFCTSMGTMSVVPILEDGVFKAVGL